ncbi:MAG: hypothetical protein LBI56_00770 [Puniceicoccales bacterium]|nr:hypothetical protein [Puniceicoccales bacterium]
MNTESKFLRKNAFKEIVVVPFENIQNTTVEKAFDEESYIENVACLEIYWIRRKILPAAIPLWYQLNGFVHGG